MPAAEGAGQTPERIGDSSQIRSRGCRRGIEGLVVLTRPGRHDESAVGPEDLAESLDQARRSALGRAHGPERSMDQQDPALLDAEGAELPGDLRLSQRCTVALALGHLCLPFGSGECESGKRAAARDGLRRRRAYGRKPSNTIWSA